ncbi:unnamed protein product [Aureobasidium pullulans]|nr:unnamed protein product [Aureobasidium pullulans]
MRKKQDDTPTTQGRDLDTERDVQRAIKSAHSHKDSTWKGPQTASTDLSRPRTASKAPTQDINSQLPPPPSARNFPDPRTFKLPNGPSRRMSMTPSPRTTTPGLTIHANHSTPGIDFNPADIAPPPALPKAPSKDKDSAKSSIHSKISSKDPVPAVPSKDGKKLHRNSISVDKTRDMQKASTRAQFTKSLGDPSALPRLKLENLSALEPPPSRSFARSPSAESTMSQYFDAASHTSGPSMPATPLEGPTQRRLNVNIPAVEMERYSVMFEKLLKPQASLMERRQTIVKQLNLPNQPSGGSPALQRRATSPNLSCRTPVTAEMIGDGSQVATPVPIYRASNTPRLLRSQTAPPGALTPSRLGYEQQTKAPSTTNNSSACSTNSHMWSDASQPQTPASDAESFVSFDINDDDEDSGDDDEHDETEGYIHDAVAMQATPLFRDPHWRNDTPTMAAPPIPPKALGRRSPPAFELEQQAATINRPHPPRTSSLDDTAAKRKTRTGPQIGIARQISVVRRPQPGGLTVPSPAKVKSPAMIDPSAPMPVFSKQPLRPKLVDVRNRKSTLVVLDEA